MVGGTFDPLHDGHRRLISRSFELAGRGGSVTIGLTTDAFASRKVHPVRCYEDRKASLESFIRDMRFPVSWSIVPLSDRYGSALDADFDALVSQGNLAQRRQASGRRYDALQEPAPIGGGTVVAAMPAGIRVHGSLPMVLGSF